MTSTAWKLVILGAIGAFTFFGTLAMDVYAAARPDEYPPTGWAPFGVHALLMTFASVNGGTAMIGWLLKRRSDEVYTAAYRHGAHDILTALTGEEQEALLLHHRRAGHSPW